MILASRRDQGTTRVREIAEEKGLSEKFLHSIMLELKHGGIVKSVRGAKGGYELRRDPHDLRVSEIVSLIDGPSLPFEEARLLHSSRDRENHALYQLFLDLHDASARILNDTTLADLIAEDRDTEVPVRVRHSEHR
jgi:Rrf2 family cysteine metabolism transcriptional repressor